MISAREHATALAHFLRQDLIASSQIKNNIPPNELIELLGLTPHVYQLLAEVAQKTDVRVDISLTPEKVIIFEIDGKPIVKLAPSDAFRLAENLHSAVRLSNAPTAFGRVQKEWDCHKDMERYLRVGYPKRNGSTTLFEYRGPKPVFDAFFCVPLMRTWAGLSVAESNCHELLENLGFCDGYVICSGILA